MNQPAGGPDFWVGQIDGDANPDIMYAVSFDTWGVAFGNGTGNVSAPPWDVYGNSAFPTGFVGGTFGGDAQIDLVLTYPFLESYRFFNTSGASPASAGDLFIGQSCPHLIAPNLTGGAQPHLVGGCDNGDIVVVDPVGDGTFTDDAYWDAGGAVGDVVSCDFNADGNLDIAASNTEDGTIAVYDGDGTGSLSFPPDEIDVGANPTALACADIDNDGDDDLVVINFDDQTLSVAIGLGSEGFENFPMELEVNGQTRRDPSDVILADINEDGSLDIVVANAFHDETQEPIDFSNIGVFMSNP